MVFCILCCFCIFIFICCYSLILLISNSHERHDMYSMRRSLELNELNIFVTDPAYLCNKKYNSSLSWFFPSILSYLISSYYISSHFIPSHFIPSHFIPSHFISSHLISSHLISSHLIPSLSFHRTGQYQKSIYVPQRSKQMPTIAEGSWTLDSKSETIDSHYGP